jgi:hypothetical protein
MIALHPPAGKEQTLVSVTLSDVELNALDHWIARRREPRPTREEAIRRLVQCGLSGHPGQ